VVAESNSNPSSPPLISSMATRSRDRFLASHEYVVLRTMANTQARALTPEKLAMARKARREASWTDVLRITLVAGEPASQRKSVGKMRHDHSREACPVPLAAHTIPRKTRLRTDLFPNDENQNLDRSGISPSMASLPCTTIPRPGPGDL
jgi:hypothetical protein